MSNYQPPSAVLQATAAAHQQQQQSSLPPALLARLQKKGIVQQQQEASPSQQEEESDWKEGFDQTYQTKYWYNTKSGLSSWEEPDEVKAARERAAVREEEDEEARYEGLPLPEGWEETTDLTTGP